MTRTIQVGPQFPLKKGDVILVKEPNGVRLRYEVTSTVSPDRKKTQSFDARVSVYGGRA